MCIINMRKIVIFGVSFLLTLLILFTCKQYHEYSIIQKMSIAVMSTSRTSDGAINQIVMSGEDGYIEDSEVYVRFLSDGTVSVVGENNKKSFIWKKIADLSLEAGVYTLGEKSNIDEETIQLQISYSNENENVHYFWNNEPVRFTLIEPKDVRVYIRIFPLVSIKEIIKPVLYKED